MVSKEKEDNEHMKKLNSLDRVDKSDESQVSDNTNVKLPEMSERRKNPQENGLSQEITADGLLSKGAWDGLLKAVGLLQASKLLDAWQRVGYTPEECEKRAKEAIEQEAKKEQEKQKEEDYGMGL